MNLIYDNFNEVHLFFDNVKNENEFNIIFNYFQTKEIKGYVYIYIQFNSETLDLFIFF